MNRAERRFQSRVKKHPKTKGAFGKLVGYLKRYKFKKVSDKVNKNHGETLKKLGDL